MLYNKKLNKIEHYWLTDVKFRAMVWRSASFNEFYQYSDLNWRLNEKQEFFYGVKDLVPRPPLFTAELEPFYYLGVRLGLGGKIFSLISHKSLFQDKSRDEIEKLIPKLNINFSFSLDYFFQGLNGYLYFDFPENIQLINLAGYDIFYEKHKK